MDINVKLNLIFGKEYVIYVLIKGIQTFSSMELLPLIQSYFFYAYVLKDDVYSIASSSKQVGLNI